MTHVPETPQPATAGPPDNWLPGSAAISVVLARSDAHVVGLTGLQLFGTGFLGQLWLSSPGETLRPAPGMQGLLGEVRLRVAYADGRSGTLQSTPGVLPGSSPFEAGQDEEVLVLPRSGSGGPRLWRQEIWVSPLPPRGPVLVQTTVGGRPDATTQLSGDELREAADRAVLLWDAEEPPEPVLNLAVAPPLPPQGDLPLDAAGAERDVRTAFQRAFTAGGDRVLALASVQDGRVLAGAAEQARRGFPLVAATLRVALGGVSFLDQVRAAVQYELLWEGEGGFGPQLGYAVRERGEWKVSRDTYGRMLSWAGVTLPPPPPAL